jgi:hypothetical protein
MSAFLTFKADVAFMSNVSVVSMALLSHHLGRGGEGDPDPDVRVMIKCQKPEKWFPKVLSSMLRHASNSICFSWGIPGHRIICMVPRTKGSYELEQ